MMRNIKYHLALTDNAMEWVRKMNFYYIKKMWNFNSIRLLKENHGYCGA